MDGEKKPTDTRRISSAGRFDLDAVLATVVRLVTIHAPESITFSKVARATGVARSTLYYYFGNSKEAMIEEAVRFGMIRFVQLSSFGDAQDYPDWATFQKERFLDSAKFIRRNPWAPGLYFRYRNDRGKLGEGVRQVEIDYLRKLQESLSIHGGPKVCTRALRVSTYLRLGLLWGVAQEPELWQDEKQTEALSELMTHVATLVMESRFDEVGSKIAPLKQSESDAKRRTIASRKKLPAGDKTHRSNIT